MNSAADGAQSYEIFAQDVQKCTRCPLAKTRTNVVVSRGNPKADLAFIGEAPGYHEDLEGLPFVGASGRLLDEMCAQMRLKPSEYVLFNILKCRPPNNEFPTGGVVKKCLPLLDHQMDLIGPRVVILVGSQAAQYLVWRSYPQAPRMMDLVGQWIWSQAYPHIDFLAMYHPAYLLRLEDSRPLEFDDAYEDSLDTIELAMDLLDGKRPPVEPLVVGSQVLIERARRRLSDG